MSRNLSTLIMMPAVVTTPMTNHSTIGWASQVDECVRGGLNDAEAMSYPFPAPNGLLSVSHSHGSRFHQLMGL